MTKAEEEALCQRYKGEERRTRLIEQYMGMACQIASGYVSEGVEFEDLRGAAYMGLCIAAKRYDPGKGRFYQIAYPWINQQVQEEKRKHQTVKAPASATADWHYKVKPFCPDPHAPPQNLLDLLIESRGQDAGGRWTQARLNLSLAVGCMIRVPFDPKTTKDTWLNRRPRNPLTETLTEDDKGYQEAEESIDRAKASALIDQALNLLIDPRERRIVWDHLTGEKKLREIGEEMGITRERVRQIEKKAVEKLRKGTKGELLRAALEAIV